MEENEDENSAYVKVHLEQLKREEQRQKIINDTYEDLKNNPKYKDFFEEYNPASIEGFIHDYARGKGNWMMHGELFFKLETDDANMFRNRADRGLWEIQQKKLFNMQCLWRAGKIELKGVESGYDFQYWEKAIKICPFIEPITEEEVDLYKLYLKSSNVSTDKWTNWQDYRTYKNEYLSSDDVCEMPDWYEFYDGRKGTGSLFLLPDFKGDIEHKYFMDGHDHAIAVNVAIHNVMEVGNPTPKDTRPHLFGSEETFDLFIKEFEDDKVFLDFHRLHKKQRKADWDYEIDVSEFTDKLFKSDDIVPIKTHWNWREAIENAWNDYFIKRIHDCMDGVYEDYLLRLHSGIPFELNEKEIESGRKTADFYKNMILDGRAAAGEPRDFNF